jgi:hypothetical protein
LIFTDADSDILTYTATVSSIVPGGLPGWLTFTPSTRTFTSTAVVPGRYQVLVHATDQIDSAFGGFILRVNYKPVFNGVTFGSPKHGHAYSYTMPVGTFTDADPEDTHTYSAFIVPQDLS